MTPYETTLARILARQQWLEHLHECTLCPVNLCDKGIELAAEVRATMAPEETWEWA